MANPHDAKAKVLFVCIGNMCRSPMAEGFARAYGDDILEAYSAGTFPTGVVSEDAIMTMDELGIDISGQRSKGLDALPVDEMTIVVAMGGTPASRLVPKGFRGRLLDWNIDDPIGRSLLTFRRVRDEIGARVARLVKELRENQ